MIVKTLTIFSLALLININIFSQDTITYTLSQVVEIAQKQSPDAQKAKHSFRYSYWSYRFYKADYLPLLQLDASLPNINRSFNEVSSATDGSISYILQSSANYAVDLSLSQKIGFTGGDIFLSSGFRRLDNFYSDTSTSEYLANMINVGIRQPIFSYNPYKWLKKIEPMKYEEAKRTVVETNEKIAATSVEYFFFTFNRTN
jgi:outer membrane protein TolC